MVLRDKTVKNGETRTKKCKKIIDFSFISNKLCKDYIKMIVFYKKKNILTPVTLILEKVDPYQKVR